MKNKTEEGLIVDETLDAYDTQTTTEKKTKNSTHIAPNSC